MFQGAKKINTILNISVIEQDVSFVRARGITVKCSMDFFSYQKAISSKTQSYCLQFSPEPTYKPYGYSSFLINNSFPYTYSYLYTRTT